MGLSLKDFGNFAVGAIDKDRQNTGEKFKIRNEELQANRKSLIARNDARYKKARDANNKGYEKTLGVESIYNRLLIFDSYQYHGVENFYDENVKEERLTLITFFSQIQGVNTFPIPNVRRFF